MKFKTRLMLIFVIASIGIILLNSVVNAVAIPNKNAKAEDIVKFIINDHKTNKRNGIKEAAKDKQLISQWQKTLERENSSDSKIRDAYKEIIKVLKQILQEIEKKGNVNAVIDNSAGSIDNADKLINSSNQSSSDSGNSNNNGSIGSISGGSTSSTVQNQIENKTSGLIKNMSVTAGENRASNGVYIDSLSNPGSYIPQEGIDSPEIVETTVGRILAVITNIGIVLSSVIPAILGIKYMLASVEEKAEYKKDMIPYFVGAVMLFSICTIVRILQLIGQNIK